MKDQSVSFSPLSRKSSPLPNAVFQDGAMSVTEEECFRTFAQRFALVRRCPVLRHLPMALLEVVLERMRPYRVKAGETIVQPGKETKCFYVVAQGSAELRQMEPDGSARRNENRLEIGSPFGCEALLTNGRRGEIVRMLTDGVLLTLERDDFDALIRKQLVRTVTAQIAMTMIENGYRLVDVRYLVEHDEMYISSSILIPLDELSDRIGEFDKTQRYIVYCHSGNRSAIASLTLAQEGIEALSLEGGIRDWPFDTTSGIGVRDTASF